MLPIRFGEPVVDPEPPEAERVPQEGDRQEKGRDENIPFYHFLFTILLQQLKDGCELWMSGTASQMANTTGPVIVYGKTCCCSSLAFNGHCPDGGLALSQD